MIWAGQSYGYLLDIVVISNPSRSSAKYIPTPAHDAPRYQPPTLPHRTTSMRNMIRHRLPSGGLLPPTASPPLRAPRDTHCLRTLTYTVYTRPPACMPMTGPAHTGRYRRAVRTLGLTAFGGFSSRQRTGGLDDMPVASPPTRATLFPATACLTMPAILPPPLPPHRQRVPLPFH